MRRDRAHVVQAVGELDEDDPDVRGHRHHHLAVVLRLRLVARLEGQPGQLGDAIDQAGDLVAERLAHLLERRGGVLDRVVQQRRAQRLGVEAHAGADLGHADGMDDEVLARLAPLIGVVHAGVDERVLDPRAVDGQRGVARVLLDDREQVAQQPALGGGQLGALDRGQLRARARPGPPVGARRSASSAAGAVRIVVAVATVAGATSADACCRHRPRRPARRADGAAILRALRVLAQPFGRGFALLRYRRPSSYRAMYSPVGRRALQRSPRPSAIARAGRSRSRLTSSSSASTLISRAASVSRTAMRTLTAKQALELLAGRRSPLPEASVEGGERSAETVLQLVHLLQQSVAQPRPRPNG